MKQNPGVILSAVSFVLVEPTHPGNIGGVARAMKTMGLDQLCLVNPRRFPADEATAMAAGADDVLGRSSLASSLAEAVADCSLILGTSARSRRIRWPLLPLANLAGKLAEFTQRGRAAVVFGRESSGLSNAELDLCHYLVHIPCNPAFSSLNLSSAAQVVAHEIGKHVFANDTPAAPATQWAEGGPDAPAVLEEIEGFYEHLEQTLQQTRFFANRQSISLMRRLRKLFNRAHLSQREVNILRGMLSAFEREQRDGRRSGSG